MRRHMQVRTLVAAAVKRKSSVAAVAVLAASVFGLAAGASAHSLHNAGNLYDAGNQCVYGHTTQMHDYNLVLTRSLTDETPFFGWPKIACHYKNPKPHGYLASRWESLKWGPNVGRWIMCGTQGYEYGGGHEHTLGRPTTGCGAGYYALIGSHFVYNGGWLGGHLVTDYEWLSW